MPSRLAIGRVDVPRLLGHRQAALFGQMVERPHVVEAVGQLHQDDADVVDHREQHLAEVLGLTLFAGRKADRADLGHALDDVGHLGTEELADALDGRQRVFDDVVQQAGGDGHDVELHVGEKVCNCQRMNEIRLSGVADLPLVLERREDVRAAEQLDVGVGAIRPDFLQKILEANHEFRCLIYWSNGRLAHSREKRPP